MNESPVLIRQSELAAAHRCRRKAFIRYEMGFVPPRPDGDLAGIGTLVHGLLAQYYDPAHISADLDHPFSDEDLFLGNAMFDTYVRDVESEGLDVGETTEAVELRLYARPIVTRYGEVQISVQIDHIYLDQFGRRTGRDHKTAATFFETADADFQLLTYAVVMADNGFPPERMQHNIIKRNKRTARSKPPYIQRNTIDVTPAMIAQHRAQLEEMVTAWFEARFEADGDVEFEKLWAVGKNDCSWSCDYAEICGMISAGDDYLAVLESEYLREEAPQ
jgi:PD-(D/E)XK nuclease superfamily